MKFRELEVPGIWALEVLEIWELNLKSQELGNLKVRDLGTSEITLGCPTYIGDKKNQIMTSLMFNLPRPPLHLSLRSRKALVLMLVEF